MARGFSAVATASADINARKNSSGGDFSRRRYFKIGDGETAVVRFLEQGSDVVSMWAHQKPNEIPFIPCRDQDPETGEPIGEDCPGCEAGYKKRFRGVINLIWRDAPVYETNEDGRLNFNKVVGREDAVVVWETGIEVFEDLQILDEDYNGLSSRDFKIRRKGERLNTKYSITPADPDGGAVAPSDEDLVLAENKFDLNEIVAPPSYEDWGQNRSSNSDKPKVTAVSADVSPFKRRLEN
jgi:hypothetical protein